MDTRLELVDRDELLTSDRDGYPNKGEYTLQDKVGRDKDEGAAQIDAIGRSPRNDLLGESETSDQGAPIVYMDEDGSLTGRAGALVVVTGNGRILGLRKGDGDYSSTANYDLFAEEAARRFGRPVRDDLKHPTLVRVITQKMTRAELSQFAYLSNKAAVKENSEADNMRGDGARIDAAMAAKIAPDAAAGLLSEENRPFVAALLRALASESLTTGGELNAAGVSRIRNALLGALVNAHPDAEAIIKAVTATRADESGRAVGALGIDNILNGIKDAAIHLVALKGREEWAAYDLSADIADALKDYIDFKRQNLSSIDDYLAQQTFWDSRPSLTEAIMREFFARRNSAQRVADILNAYARTAMLQDNSSPALFDTGVTPREEIWKLAVEKADAEQPGRYSVEAGAPTAAELAEAQRQYDAVVARYTKPDGTMKKGWMMAPNGKPTNLSERQWVQVRTPNFKKWFGDWEAAYYSKGWRDRIDPAIIRSLPAIDISGYAPLADKSAISAAFEAFDVVTNKNDNRKVRFPANAAGRFVYQRNHVGAYKTLFESAVRAWSESETKFGGHKEHNNIDSYHQYVNKFSNAEGEHYIRFTVREEKADSDDKNMVHGAQITGVEIYDGAEKGNGPALPEFQTGRSEPLSEAKKPRIDYKLALFLNPVNPDAVSKVVDENGEPMVVYHDSGERHNVLSREYARKSMDVEAVYFHENRDEYHEYGPVEHAVFLNVRNPANFAQAMEGFSPGSTEDAGVVQREKLQAQGFDGFWFSGEEMGSPDLAELGAFESNQIKSATDNAGTFSERPDIRYSVTSVTPAEDAAYMDAVKRGDMETTQRMVREAAAKAGYTTEAWHGDRYDPNYTVYDESQTEYHGFWAWTDANNNRLEEYGENGTKHVYLKADNILKIDDDSVTGNTLDLMLDKFEEAGIELPAEIKEEFSEGRDVALYEYLNDIIPSIRAAGYDGISIREDGRPSVAVFSPSQIKSADPVTYDDAGNVIPLSKRFNEHNPDIRYSISGIYTGGAADYEKPSLHYVGTGEGSQVYGWGLYGSAVRGVADVYAGLGRRQGQMKFRLKDGARFFPADDIANDRIVRIIQDKLMSLEKGETVADAVSQFRKSAEKMRIRFRAIDAAETYEKAADALESVGDKVILEWKDPDPSIVYEQTFFTNRATPEETERHLLKWYEPVSEEQKEWVERALREEFPEVEPQGGTIIDAYDSGERLYTTLESLLHSPKAASELLARAGIDGVKYPVDSYGAKGVKDGDEVGWNYVSFRDDNVRIDHKWVDGRQRYSIEVRNPWPADFPNATVMTTRGAVTRKHGELFEKAKAGDTDAAAELVDAIMADPKRRAKLDEIKARHPNAEIACPVHAEEEGGRNKIPLALAQYAADALGMRVDSEIVQTVRAHHTGKDAWYRLTHRALFGGSVEAGKKYILVDDHITQGGTINELRNYIENNGGRVVDVFSLTASQGSTILKPSEKQIAELRRRYGDELEQLLIDGDIAAGADAITASEAAYILKLSPDTFRNRVAAAGQERRAGAARWSVEASAAREQLEFDFGATPEETARRAKKYAKAKKLDKGREAGLVADIEDAKAFSEETRALYAKVFSGDLSATAEDWAAAFAAPESNEGDFPTVSRVVGRLFKKPTEFPATALKGLKVRTSEDVAALMMLVRSPYQETIKAVFVDEGDNVLDAQILAAGGASSAPLDPQQLFGAIPRGASALYFSHNHPSGDPSPSRQDADLTGRVAGIAKALGFEVRDHVITDGETYYSFQDGRTHTLPAKRQIHERWETGTGEKIRDASRATEIVSLVRQNGRQPAVVSLGNRTNVDSARLLPEDFLDGDPSPADIARAFFGAAIDSRSAGVLIALPGDFYASKALIRQLVNVGATLGVRVLDVLTRERSAGAVETLSCARYRLLPQAGEPAVASLGETAEGASRWSVVSGAAVSNLDDAQDLLARLRMARRPDAPESGELFPDENDPLRLAASDDPDERADREKVWRITGWWQGLDGRWRADIPDPQIPDGGGQGESGARGGDSAYEQYFRLAGEVEARNVQARAKMSPEERAETPPWETEDVAEDRQIVRAWARLALAEGREGRFSVEAFRAQQATARAIQEHAVGARAEDGRVHTENHFDESGVAIPDDDPRVVDIDLRHAEENHKKLVGIVDTVAGQFAERGVVAHSRTKLKGRDRIEQKTASENFGDYTRTVDHDGSTLELPDGVSFKDVHDAILAALPEGVTEARVKLLNFKEDAIGYQDVKIALRFPNGGVGEIILVNNVIAKGKAEADKGGGNGHAVYEVRRTLEAELKREDLTEEDREALLAARDACRALEADVYAPEEPLAFEAHKESASSLVAALQERSTLASSESLMKSVKSASSEFQRARPASLLSKNSFVSGLNQTISATSLKSNNTIISQDGENVKENSVDGGARLSVVSNAETISRLEDEVAAGDYYVTYRAVERVTLPDGTEALVPPMNGWDPETRQHVDPVHEGDWVRADVDEAGIIDDGKGDHAHYRINYRVTNQATGRTKTQGTTVAFNPYIHSSFNPFNDQFKAAYNRPGMVVVRLLVPKSAASGPKAHPRAKDAPGLASWKAGEVASQLKALGKPERKVLLSNYGKIDRVLSYAEVADLFDEMAEGVKDRLEIPEEVMPPGLRDEMESRGYRIRPMGSAAGENVNFELTPRSIADAMPEGPRQSIVARNPLGGLSRNSLVVAMAAQDKLRGIARPPEHYAELAKVLGASIDAAKAAGEADSLIAAHRDELTATVGRDAADAVRATARTFDRDNFARHVSALFAGSAKWGTEVGGAAQEGWHRVLAELVSRAPGYDLETLRLDTGGDLTKTLMEILPEVFAPSDEKGAGKKDGEGDGEGAEGYASPDEFVGPPTAETWRKWNENAAERRARYNRVIAAAKLALAERQRRIKAREEARAKRVEEARKRAEAERKDADAAADQAEREADREDGIGDEDSAETAEALALPLEVVESMGVDLGNADEFASFMRAWVCDWLARKNPGKTYADVLDDPVALATYRRTMIAQLRDIASALLDPTEGHARTMAERMIGDIRDDATADELERRTSDIIGFIQRNAIRQKRKVLIRETLAMVEKMAVRGRKFDALERDMKRKILGEHEAYARYIAKVITMSDGAIERETQRLLGIIEGRKEKYGEAEAELGVNLDYASDAEVHKAQEQLAALRQYGGLKNKMPSYIVAAKKQLEAWLGGEREAHERRWGEFQAACDEVADAVEKAVRAGRGKWAPDEPGLGGRIYEDIVASVRQRLEDMMAGADSEARRDAIGRVMRLLSEGSQQREVLRVEYRRQLEGALADAVKGTELDVKGLVAKLEEKIPEDLNDLLDSEVRDADGNVVHARQRVRMTWGQAMQLYASLLQTATYGENVALHGRKGHAEAIRAQAHPALLKLVNNLRRIYDARRAQLSDTVREVTGLPIYNPDPMYMPVKMYTGAREGTDTRTYGWSPLARSLTPRVRNRRDFDLSADLMATLAGRTEEAVNAISFGVRGIALRSMLMRGSVVNAMAQSVGRLRTRKLVEQLTDTLTDGFSIDEQRGGLMSLVSKAGTATTYAALSFNLVTALKQMQSLSAWVPLLEGGYLELGRHILNFDMDAARELVNSPGFVARYGSSNFVEMLRGALSATEGSFISRCAKAGMTAIQIGDFVPGVVVGTGVYKARVEALMRQNPGMAAQRAKEQAATETWALIEECQQTGRLEDTPHMLRRWGVMGRQVTKFATAPIQQVAHELHAFKAMADARGMGNEDAYREARAKFVNVCISNHIILPAAFYAVATLFGMALGDEPPEGEELFGDLLLQMLVGPWSRIFFAGAILESTLASAVRLTGLKPHTYPHADIPAAQTLNRLKDKAFLTASDIANADAVTVANDLLDMAGTVNAPVRYATKGARNWIFDYDQAKHRREAKKERERRRAAP